LVFADRGAARGATRRRRPNTTLILMTNKGNRFRNTADHAWVPIRGLDPGTGTYVSEGPKGLKVSLISGVLTGNYPREIWRELWPLRGAELIRRPCHATCNPAKGPSKV